MATLRSTLWGWWMHRLLDTRLNPAHRLLGAKVLAGCCMSEWYDSDSRRRAAARAAGEELLRQLAALETKE